MDELPNHPTHYEMRNWHEVACKYDSLVFDRTLQGQYLPLCWINLQPINYPEHNSFGLVTVVGSTRGNAAEAINVLPAVVGATLVDIDKQNQFGQNWVLMCEEFFNKTPEEQIYLNTPTATSGEDWWYETMPNVFFYQLYDLYRGTGDFDNQFTSVAGQWLRALEVLGGGTTPWTLPNLNYRAFAFSTLAPLTTGVPEPEAAGAIAWILYHAWQETGQTRYRVGAEWALEFLNHYPENPSYELQLPYGVYIAARMNAELGTTYNLEKLVNWCFQTGPLRPWGMITGSWGGYDVGGLIGENSSNDYAFLMNGFQQAAALVPMTRYAPQFARDVGKWVLNLANASRLFYSPYLLRTRQDNAAWSRQYDPFASIGYEALRQWKYGQSPYATGDAIAGGWGLTNLALYGSSHVGYLGAIVDTTRIENILKLDLRKTDFFQKNALPSFLYYNPYVEEKSIVVNTGSRPCHLYDAVSHTLLVNSVSGSARISLAPESARIVVLIPSTSHLYERQGILYADSLVVDYHATPVTNPPPRIKSLAAATPVLAKQDSTLLYCTAEDRNHVTLSYDWMTGQGVIKGNGNTVMYKSMDTTGPTTIRCTVTDGAGASVSDSVVVTVIANQAPQIQEIRSTATVIDPGDSVQLSCFAVDPDLDALYYEWRLSGGEVLGTGPDVIWMPPETPAFYAPVCQVSDPSGAMVADSVSLWVGDLLAHYPFDGSGQDISGYDHHATVTGGTWVTDQKGSVSALSFNGIDDYCRVTNARSLMPGKELTVCLWARPAGPFSHEQYLISHGSWQHRYKLSLLADRRIRWTVHTENGIIDLDSRQVVQKDSLYHLAVCYRADQVDLYINGSLHSQTEGNGGVLLNSPHDLTFAQMLPGDAQWNYTGELEDILIYARSLTPAQIRTIYGEGVTSVSDKTLQRLHPNLKVVYYPNPFKTTLTSTIETGERDDITVEIYNVLGQRVRTDRLPVGTASWQWDGRDVSGHPVANGLYWIRVHTGTRTVVTRVVKCAGDSPE